MMPVDRKCLSIATLKTDEEIREIIWLRERTKAVVFSHQPAS